MANDAPPRIALGYVFGLIGVAIFGATLPATRIAVEFFDPWFVTYGRAVIASALAVIILLALRKRFPAKTAMRLFIAGLLLVYGFPGFTAIAMTTVPASHGGVVLGILPLATAVFAAILAGERPSIAFWTCGILGAAIVVIFTLREGDMHFSSGDFWLLLAGLSASCGYVISGTLSRAMPGWEVICWALVLTLPISLIGSIATWEPVYMAPPAGPLWAFAYVSLFSMFLGFFAWNTGLAIGGLAKIGQLQLLQTFVTLGVAALINRETITLETIFFALAVVIVVALGRWTRVH